MLAGRYIRCLAVLVSRPITHLTPQRNSSSFRFKSARALWLTMRSNSWQANRRARSSNHYQSIICAIFRNINVGGPNN